MTKLRCALLLLIALPAFAGPPDAKAAFDEGMACVFGFDHERAIGCFERAAKADPALAMAFWGHALALGPHINNPAMEGAAWEVARDRIAKAQANAEGLPERDRALIAALAKRYATFPPDHASYADAMREVRKAHPADADVGALFAESLLNLRPWDQWTPDGKPQPGTEECVAVLESVLAAHPGHPGACHYYIHAMEASPTPGKALDAANRLRERAGATSHLVHMPAHIDMRLGHYANALACNERAVAIDREAVKQGRGLGFYTIYRAHNLHFLTWAAMYGGQRAKAVFASLEIGSAIPVELLRSMPDYVEAFLGAHYCVLVRFGMWQEILDLPAPPADYRATTAYWRYARCAALATLRRVEEAEREQRAFLEAAKAVPDTAVIGNNKVHASLAIAESLVAGEIAYRKGEFDAAFAHLRDGVAKEDALKYDEPWGWMQPVRHALGALLLEQGRVEEAEKVYRADLARHPDNGWSLHGLAECLRTLGRLEEAAAVDARFKGAWGDADIELAASCFCRTAAGG